MFGLVSTVSGPWPIPLRSKGIRRGRRTDLRVAAADLGQAAPAARCVLSLHLQSPLCLLYLKPIFDYPKCTTDPILNPFFVGFFTPPARSHLFSHLSRAIASRIRDKFLSL